jgi:hypothetical protein
MEGAATVGGGLGRHAGADTEAARARHARALRRRAKRGAALVGSICFAVPLFEHAKLKNFE